MKLGQKVEDILQKQNRDKLKVEDILQNKIGTNQGGGRRNLGVGCHVNTNLGQTLPCLIPHRSGDKISLQNSIEKEKERLYLITFCRGKKMFLTIGFYCSFDLNLANFSLTVLSCQLCWDMGGIASCHL